MEIKKTLSGTSLTVEVSGRIDTTTAPQLDAELTASLTGITDLVFDLANVDYVSSAGLRVFLSAQKKMNKQGTMTLIHVCSSVMEVFELTGFVDILTIK